MELSLLVSALPSIGGGPAWQPSLLAIPSDGLSESFLEPDVGGAIDIAAPADPIGMIELTHLVGRKERSSAGKPRDRHDRVSRGHQETARQVDRPCPPAFAQRRLRE